jgi:hypothetical protein
LRRRSFFRRDAVCDGQELNILLSLGINIDTIV